MGEVCVVGKGGVKCVVHDRTTVKYPHTFPQYGACMTVVWYTKVMWHTFLPEVLDELSADSPSVLQEGLELRKIARTTLL